ncbi:HET-domain-containing protein [Xylaria curta]|nr:HET-domain-containing protein [Xylaria curta]
MPFCPLCSNLDFSAISRTSVRNLFSLCEMSYPDHYYFYYHPFGDPRQIENNLTPHYDSLRRLSVNAKSCKMCDLIKNSMATFLKGLESRQALGLAPLTPNYELYLVGRDGADGFQIIGLERGSATRQPVYALMGGVGFDLRNAESHLKDVIQRRMIPLSPSSPPVLEMIKSWIEECTEKHEHKLPRQTFMPTRLLKIADSGHQVYLQSQGAEHSRYAVLSYCWGSITPTTLTSRNIHRLEAGIRTEKLPKTFQDAIWLTNELNIQFLWIDSLCIVQDDPDDWAQESARMHDVYNNSFVTIAASRASHSSKGFLANRVEKSYVPVPFPCQGIIDEVLAFSLPLNHVANQERSIWMEYEPLSHRGWALQERYLSRRTLHFATESTFSHKYSSILTTMSGDRFKEMDEKSCFEEWYRLAWMYSKRKLTQEDDKFPALGGLAAYFSGQCSVKSDDLELSNRYLAGLWSGDIIRGLCWHCEGSGTRPAEYRAPSWSWASLDGRIQYMPLHIVNELAVVRNAHVDLESPSRSFGKVLGGWISMKVIKLRPHAESVLPFGNLRLSEDETSFILGCSWDLAPVPGQELVLSIMKETELVVIPLGWTEQQGQHPDDKIFGPLCLILKRVNSSNHSEITSPIFQRVGSGVAMSESEWEGNEDMNRLELERLITGKWTAMKQQGNLEEIVII